jgi:hypothetical protein
MEFGKAFTFVFSDQSWIKKILILGLVSLIPIIGQMVLLGWSLQITRQIIKNEVFTLPDLHFGEQLSLGFKGFVIALVFALPAILFSLPGAAVGPLGQAFGFDEKSLSTMTILVSICCGGIQLIYSVGIAFFLPAAYGNFVDKGILSAGFRLGELFRLVKASPVAYLLVVLGSMLASFIAGLGLIACIIGAIFTFTYSQAVVAHLTGQAYREAQTKALIN